MFLEYTCEQWTGSGNTYRMSRGDLLHLGLTGTASLAEELDSA